MLDLAKLEPKEAYETERSEIIYGYYKEKEKQRDT